MPISIKSVKHYFNIFGYSLLVILGACKEIRENKEVEPEEFVKIYDNTIFSDSFEPIDHIQLIDKSYIFISKVPQQESAFPGIYVLNTDTKGEYLSGELLPNNYVAPVQPLLKTPSGVYIFCMDRLSLQSKLLKIERGTVKEVATINAAYPLAASVDANSQDFLLMHYDRESRQTVIKKINAAGQIIDAQEFEVGFGDFDPEQSIIAHLTGTGKSLPFFCGNLSNDRYYFNGYYNYSLSMVFFNFGNTKNTGVINGYQEIRTVSGAIVYNGNIALSNNIDGMQYFLPKASIASQPGSISSNSDLGGFPMIQLPPHAKISIAKGTLEGKNVIVYGSHTRNRQIILYFYDQSNGRLIGVKELGYTYPYEIASVQISEDNILTVSGTTWITNRFSRICLFRLSTEEVKRIINNQK